MPAYPHPRRVLILALALALGLALATLAPAGAAFSPTKGQIKKLVKKMSANVAAKQVKKLGPGIAAAQFQALSPGIAPRVGAGTIAGMQIPSGPAVIAATSVVAPGNGFLVLHGDSDTANYNGTEWALCWLRLNGADITSSARWTEFDFGSTTLNADDAVFVNGEENCATHAVVPVGPGTQTVALMADSLSGFYDTEFWESTISALFVPLGPTGAAPTSATFSAAERGQGAVDIRRIAEERGIPIPTRR